LRKWQVLKNTGDIKRWCLVKKGVGEVVEGEEELDMVKERVMVMMVREERERERVRREVVKEVEKVEEDTVKKKEKKTEEGEGKEVGEVEKEEERLND
jgi:hypothetical protein